MVILRIEISNLLYFSTKNFDHLVIWGPHFMFGAHSDNKGLWIIRPSSCVGGSGGLVHIYVSICNHQISKPYNWVAPFLSQGYLFMVL
jgi:hypothetical protein